MRRHTRENTGAPVAPRPVGLGEYLTDYVRQSWAVLKNPKQMLPTIALGVVWLVLALLGSLEINPLPVRILSFLTFAEGGMFGGIFGAVGGIVGKVVFAAFLNVTLIPLFQKKKPFAGGGLKAFFAAIAGKSAGALFPLLGGIGLALLLYAFMNTTQSLQNSMVGVAAFIMLLQNTGRQGGFWWGLLFSLAGTLSKGKMPSYQSVNRGVGGMALGFALGTALTVAGLQWAVWTGLLFLAVTFILALAAKNKKGVATA